MRDIITSIYLLFPKNDKNPNDAAVIFPPYVPTLFPWRFSRSSHVNNIPKHFKRLSLETPCVIFNGVARGSKHPQSIEILMVRFLAGTTACFLATRVTCGNMCLNKGIKRRLLKTCVNVLQTLPRVLQRVFATIG
jgi:hypothetical protein